MEWRNANFESDWMSNGRTADIYELARLTQPDEVIKQSAKPRQHKYRYLSPTFPIWDNIHRTRMGRRRGKTEQLM
jgi:hypothetical protein